MTITIVTGDITELEIDCIVNAANAALAPGSGVDGAIRRAAGPALTDATRAIGGCPTGEAVITPGFDLNARFVIHTVAPIFAQHTEEETRHLLRRCYANSLVLAQAHQIEAIAFPALGTGIYGVPMALACPIAVSAVRTHLTALPLPRRVLFCCNSERDAEAYRLELKKG
ncbi:MAG TPA: hypothetical protein DCL54_01250 [Alphaproteobacteria bacterium]|nr:hypothetical protein [Alphaproteobacteria bacterium]